MLTSDPSPSNSTGSFVYYLGPFRFESEMEIPELRALTGTGDVIVALRLGSVPTAISAAVTAGPGCYVSAAEYLLEIPGTARYYVRSGNEVRVEIVPGTPIANVSTYLLGSCFGALCHQNGFLPLHASAVEAGGAVTAFLGDSGAGKSTLAACLRERGHRIVSDDICLLQEVDDQIRVIPVAGWLKLWNQSLQHLGKTPEEQNRVFSTDDKFRLFLSDAPSSTASARAQLHRIIFLAKNPDPEAQPTLQPVPMLDGIGGLMDLTYAGYVPVLAGQKSRLFQQCARVMRHATAWRLTVPWDLARIDSVVDLLQREVFR